MDKNRVALAIVAITWISILEIVAMHYDINGALFGIVIAAVAGLGGYGLSKKRAK